MNVNCWVNHLFNMCLLGNLCSNPSKDHKYNTGNTKGWGGGHNWESGVTNTATETEEVWWIFTFVVPIGVVGIVIPSP